MGRQEDADFSEKLFVPQLDLPEHVQVEPCISWEFAVPKFHAPKWEEIAAILSGAGRPHHLVIISNFPPSLFLQPREL